MYELVCNAMPELRDQTARGLSEFKPEGAAIEAGRVLLRCLHHLTAQRLDVAFETTLASRSFAPWIRELMRLSGYAFYLFFISLPSPELAIERVAERVRRGGHSVPDEVIRKRFDSGLRNFFSIYRPIATRWRFFDNSVSHRLRLIAQWWHGLGRQALRRGNVEAD